MSDGPRLLVADSFRVRQHPTTGRAEVRGWSRHLDRFSRAVGDVCASGLSASYLSGTEHSPISSRAELESFLQESARRIAAFGEGFPRLELWQDAAGTRFSLNLRPAPPLGDTLEMRTAPEIILDHPGRKGPNIGRLRELNRTLGAEALLLDTAGNALEGATTSLMWWEPGASTAYVVASPQPASEHPPANRVPSITESLLRDAVDVIGQDPGSSGTARVDAGLVPPARLVQSEVWAVNALHGIRVVTTIDGQTTLPPHRDRLDRLRTELDRSWELVLPPSPSER